MNAFRANLMAGKPQLGLCMMYPAPGIIERIGVDWDWIWIDGQHGELAYHDVLAMVRASNLVRRPAFVRVPGHEFGLIGQSLDCGADGLIVPCVDTLEQAQGVINAAKFPPVGKRSYGGRRPIDLRGRSYAETANDDIMLAVQIESPEAVENVDAIAALPGVDALFLGPDDIMLRRGYSMNQPRTRETLGSDMEAVATACRRHGKIAAIVGMGAEMLTLSIQFGFTLIVHGGDVPFLVGSSKETASKARAMLQGKVRVDGAAGRNVLHSPY